MWQTNTLRPSQNALILLLSLLLGVGLAGLSCRKATALDQETLLLLTDPLKPSQLQPGNIPSDGSVRTPDTISQTGLTSPSLWWAQEQFGGDLLTYWFAFSGTDGTPPRVDLLVNEQVWTNYDYLQRYAFINQFGTVAKDFGYSTRVFNAQGELLGAYICTTSADTVGALNSALPAAEVAFVRSPACRIFLNPYGQGSLRGATPFGGLQPTGGGTAP